MGANTFYTMTESYKKGPRWPSFWWRKPESIPESPNTGCSRGSKRERLRRALSQKLKSNQFSAKHRKANFLKWPKRQHFSPHAAVTASPDFTLNDLPDPETMSPLVAVDDDKPGHENEIRPVEGAGGETGTEGVFSVGKSAVNERSVSGRSVKQVPVLDHTLLSKIRSKWLKPDVGPGVVGASNRKPIAFLHEMRPGFTTTEVSYTNA